MSPPIFGKRAILTRFLRADCSMLVLAGQVVCLYSILINQSRVLQVDAASPQHFGLPLRPFLWTRCPPQGSC
ncbi:hypothetical protein BX616_009912 [Lobosporangium transversale]|nr:hypothetical protein BX616_009912 [Lobosporangium transversale]